MRETLIQNFGKTTPDKADISNGMSNIRAGACGETLLFAVFTKGVTVSWLF